MAHNRVGAVPDRLTLLCASGDSTTLEAEEDLQGFLLVMRDGAERMAIVLDEPSVKKLEARIRKFWRDRR